MGQADRPAELERSYDDGARQALISLAAMLAFVGVGVGLAAWGIQRLRKADPAGEYSPAGSGAATVGTSGGDRVTGGGTGSAAAAPAPPQGDQARRIQQLIIQLDSSSWPEREQAQNALRDYGERARAALEEARRDPPSPEVGMRVQILLDALDARKQR